MVYYRVVQICRAYDSFFGEGKGWIYCSNGILDYKNALQYAINHDKQFPWNKTWVEADYFDGTKEDLADGWWWHEISRPETLLPTL